ncbi:hypothetical protein ACHAPU_010823 [Fusarium lateritium]
MYLYGVLLMGVMFATLTNMVWCNFTSAPGYLSSLVIPPSALSWKVWRSKPMISTASSTTDKAASTQTLKFRRPIPLDESDILPDAISRCESSLSASSPTHALAPSFASSHEHAQRLKKLNENLIDAMELGSAAHLTRLHHLLGAIDMIQAELNKTATGSLAVGSSWCLWKPSETLQREVLASYVKWYADIVHDMISTREAEHKALHDVYFSPGMREQSYLLCKMDETLREVGVDKDLQDTSSIICSSEIRTNACWNKVWQAISKFKLSLGRTADNIKGHFNNPGPVAQSYQALSESVQGIMQELYGFSQL